ncbi:MAG: GTP-binding protein [Synechococcus sp. LacPavin_0920_WC12_MAG_50_7]|nr:GTP-binding protein [Synechococcus sp. LacPavin_0920_WC12_MAG_50_7]
MSASTMRAAIRNIAIIAHVDHGKTTLVDALLQQSGTFRDGEVVPTCVLDSNDLERERGITILSKNTAVDYNDTRINIVDTPGHADFGGEVERVLGMVDGCLLIVDANEGPMPQTRFVLKKALEKGLRPIVFVNKIDRPRADPEIAVSKVLDLFIELGADDDQCDFTYLFGSGLGGYAKPDMATESENMKPLFDAILRHVPPPIGDPEKPLQLQVTTLDYSDFLGRIIIGKIHNGVIKNGQTAALLKDDGSVKKARISKLLGFKGLQRIEIQEAFAGDLVAVAGFDDVNIGETVACPDNPEALPLIKVDEPTLQMTFCVNDSPFAGKEGKFVTSRQLRDRLQKELLTNVALRVEETDSPDRFSVCGRGELHLGILIETMRREGFEFQVSQPKVIFKTIDGHTCEPYEALVLDVPEESVGNCIEKLGVRKGEMQNMETGIDSFEEGTATFYALKSAEDRGVFFITPGTKVYKGMIVGENSRPQDLELNICKAKQLTNIRSAGADELDALQTPIQMNLERALEYIGPDEMLEVTPESIRLRKLPSKKVVKR